LKLAEKHIGEILQDIGIGKDFLNRTPMTQKKRTRIDKWDCIKFKSSYTTKETLNQVKRQPTEWEEIFKNHLSNRRFKYRTYKELKKMDIKK
jgi:hypothetical protein